MKGDILLAYFAGLIEGEGYIGVKRRMPSDANHMTSPKYAVAFSIAMTDKAPVQMLAEFMQAPGLVKARLRKEHYKTIYQFDLENDRAVDLLTRIRPYLICRASHVDLALELHSLKKESKRHQTKQVGTRVWQGGRAKGATYKLLGMSDEFILKCEIIYQKLKRMSPRSGKGAFKCK